jgi:methylmalonyl-CoA epimerase
MRLHHIAYVCADLESTAKRLCEVCGCMKVGDPVVDAHQGARIVFLDAGTDTQIELLEPIGLKSPLQRHLTKGGGLYHFCFEVDNLKQHLIQILKPGEVCLVKEPAAAPAIEGRKVAFVVNAQGDLIEFVERCKSEESENADE